jgi:putative membrane protein
MLVMMAVPALLAFAAPITLLLRTLPAGGRRALVRELQDPAFRPLSGRWAPILLGIDYYLTMFAYQLTPLSAYAEHHTVVHFAVHQYFLLCGFLFWLPIAALDPVRFHPTARVKRLMIGAGVPAFALLGAIEIAKGDTTTGWAYVVTGVALTLAGALWVADRAPRSQQARTVRLVS